MAAEVVDDPDDPRLDGYRSLRDPDRRRQIDRDQDVFVAEGLLVLEALRASPYRLRSALVSSARAEAAATLLAGVDAPLYVVPPKVLDAVAGFSVHRGVVALGERRALPDPWGLVQGARLLLVVEGVNDHENLGALFRNAAAFGVAAVLLDPTTADPLYRRCLRVSMGHVLRMPTARLTSWPDALGRLGDAGWSVLALTPDSGADEIGAVIGDLAAQRGGAPPVALLVGAEGPGLSAGALAGARRRVRIAMAPGVDSLNVATAASIALYSLSPWVAHRPRHECPPRGSRLGGVT